MTIRRSLQRVESNSEQASYLLVTPVVLAGGRIPVTTRCSCSLNSSSPRPGPFLFADCPLRDNRLSGMETFDCRVRVVVARGVTNLLNSPPSPRREEPAS